MLQDADLRIVELGLILPPTPKPAGVYKPVLVVDKFLYVSGQGPINTDGTLMKGKVETHFGDLKKIKRLVKVLGMVNSAPTFEQHPAVINGFSELMAEVFGEDNGVGVRSAVGMTLPSNIAVEIEAMFELY